MISPFSFHLVEEFYPSSFSNTNRRKQKNLLLILFKIYSKILLLLFCDFSFLATFVFYFLTPYGKSSIAGQEINVTFTPGLCFVLNQLMILTFNFVLFYPEKLPVNHNLSVPGSEQRSKQIPLTSVFSPLQ